MGENVRYEMILSFYVYTYIRIFRNTRLGFLRSSGTKTFVLFMALFTKLIKRGECERRLSFVKNYYTNRGEIELERRIYISGGYNIL